MAITAEFARSCGPRPWHRLGSPTRASKTSRRKARWLERRVEPSSEVMAGRQGHERPSVSTGTSATFSPCVSKCKV